MDKAQELIKFATENGLKIHGRTNPTEWAQALADNEGRCPCGHADSCPCEAALEKIRDPNTQPADQMCGCTFYVSTAYLEHYKRQPWKPENEKKIQDSKPAQKSRPATTSISSEYKKIQDVDPEVETAFLRTAQVYVDGLKLIEAGQLDKFTERIRMEEATNPCEMCKEDADLIASHSDYARALCSQGRPDCEEELQKLINRTVDVINEDFSSAGYATEDTSKPEKKPGKKNAWLEFSASVMSDPSLTGLPQKEKMKIAAAVYRNEYSSVEEAMVGLQK